MNDWISSIFKKVLVAKEQAIVPYGIDNSS